MFPDRFEGSRKPPGSRIDLIFRDRLARFRDIKSDWDFIEDDTLRSNIASELQGVHFDILLLNEYNVFYAPEAMALKRAIIAVATVVEAVLEVAVRMMEDDPRVRPIIEKRERVFDEIHFLRLNGFGIPDGRRVVAGVQREVIRSRLDRNAKMDLLIRAAHAGGALSEEMAKKLQQLRRMRNRIHIKTVKELEYAWYTHALANGALDILEDFRIAARMWIDSPRSETLPDVLKRNVAAHTDRACDDDHQRESSLAFGFPDDDVLDLEPFEDDDIPF